MSRFTVSWKPSYTAFGCSCCWWLQSSIEHQIWELYICILVIRIYIYIYLCIYTHVYIILGVYIYIRSSYICIIIHVVFSYIVCFPKFLCISLAFLKLRASLQLKISHHIRGRVFQLVICSITISYTAFPSLTRYPINSFELKPYQQSHQGISVPQMLWYICFLNQDFWSCFNGFAGDTCQSFIKLACLVIFAAGKLQKNMIYG